MTDNRIAWTATENLTVAQALVGLRLAQPLSPITELLTKAQDALPAERRRHLASVHVWKGLSIFSDCWRRKLADIEAGPEVHCVTVREVVEPAVETVLAKATLEQVLGALVAHIAARGAAQAVEHVVKAVAAGALKPAEIHPEAPLVAPRPVRPARLRLGVLGTTPDQFAHAETKVGERAELVFLNRDRRPSSPRGVDAVVVVSRPGGNNPGGIWMDKVRKAGPVHLVTGLTALVQKVFDLASIHATPTNGLPARAGAPTVPAG